MTEDVGDNDPTGGTAATAAGTTKANDARTSEGAELTESAEPTDIERAAAAAGTADTGDAGTSEGTERAEAAQVAEATQAQAVPGIAPSTQGRLPITFWPGLALGWGLIAFGLHNAYRKASGLGNPHGLARWVASGLIVHDGLWAPVVVIVGWVSAHWLPPPARAPVRIALALTAMLVVVFAPVYRRYGALSDNSSVDPNNSGVALLVLLGLLWATLGAASVIRIRRARP